MKRIIVAIPHSHSFFWTQTCVSSLMRNPPHAEGYSVRVIVVDNSPWSPAIKGISETLLGKMPGLHVVRNYKSNKFHASALDCVVERFGFDYLMALETDVLALRPDWLQWFVDLMRPTDYAVGMWHHEQFVNPSCTLYRGDVLREMDRWCKHLPEPNVLRWGPLFGKSQLISERQPERDYKDWHNEQIDWIAGAFAEKRGWPAGTELKEQPSGQMKGPGWYEPGQQLHHWAVQHGHTYTVCPTLTTKRQGDNVPLQTMYGAWGQPELTQDYPARPNPFPTDRVVTEDELRCRLGCGDVGHDHGRQLEAVEMFGNAYAAHLWGGTRALDILKHEVTCQFVKSNTPAWLAREARFWREVVPQHVQAQTLELIRKHGWHITGQGSDHVTDRDREAAAYVREQYAQGGVEW